MTDTLTPPRQPSASGTSGTAKARMITTAYGDGFKSTIPDGVNTIDRTATLSWDPITAVEANAIVRFLHAHSGIPFYYTLPRSLAPRIWVWTSIERTYPSPLFDALTVQLEERFLF